MKYYPTEYYPSAELSSHAYEKYIKKYQVDKVNRISRFRTSGKLLDVGSGVGYFVKEASRSGFEAQGVEFSATAARIGREQFGLNIRQGDILSNDFPTEYFDVVTFWQALEHTHHPAKVLQKARGLLKPGGFLVIAVPNFSSLQSRVFRERWYHLEVPRHLFHFEPSALGDLVEKNGFEVVHTDFFSREHNWAGILGSVIRLSPKNEPLAHKVFRKTLGLYCARAVAWLESAVRSGGTFEMVAVKRK